MNTYITALTFAIPLFVILIGVEALIAYRKGIQINRAADMISSLSSGLTNTTRDGIQFGFILLSYTWMVEHLTIVKVEPIWLAVVIAFISEDFAGYWVHRMSHRINFMWNRHIIHHSSEEFNLSCALRQSISDNVQFTTILFLPAALMGIPPEVFAIVGPVHLFLQFWYHTRLIDKMGLLEKILVTPSHHRVHHAINPNYIDKNYSQIFIIWDKLFGTFQCEEKEDPPVYGILRPARTWNPVFINFKHIWQLTKDTYHTHSYWDKIRIWFMPTGWRPEDIAIKYPLKTLDDHRDLKKYTTQNSNLLLGWSFIQLSVSLTFMFSIFFNISQLTSIWIILLAGFLIIHIMAFTLLLDGNKISLRIELVKCIIGFILFSFLFFNSSLIAPVAFTGICLYLLTSLILSIYFNRTEPKQNLALTQ
mgnify:CR=1 FL=1